MRLASLVLLLGMFLAGALGAAAQEEPPTLVLVSFDGWRWDYQERYAAPNLGRLAARGVRAANLIPSFPSKTFPNHYTLVTGLYPGHHGLISNNVRDPATGRTFRPADRREVQDPMWWGGEPLWYRVQEAGRVAAAMFWPGSEAPILGRSPRYWSAYDESLPGEARVDRVLGWLDLPASARPSFITLYFEHVDVAAHNTGPDSAATQAAIAHVDALLGRLVAGLEARRLLDRVNLVLASDHGLAETSVDRVVVLDDHVAAADVEVLDQGPLLGLYPAPGREDAVYSALSAVPRLRLYRRGETPERWHYRDHPRIPPLVGVADEGWLVLRRETLEALRARTTSARGEHGYDPEAMSMRGLFVAAGPAFRSGGVVVPAFENVHVYEALAAALGVTPARNDGDPAVAQRLLR